MFAYKNMFAANLQNYWPILSSEQRQGKGSGGVRDVVSGQSLTSERPTFVSDRSGRVHSAFRVTDESNYFSAPAGVYFNGSDFSVSGWVRFNRPVFKQRFLDFESSGEGEGGDDGHRGSVLFFLADDTMKPIFLINQEYLMASSRVTLNAWHHFAFTLNNLFGRLYVNGTAWTWGRIGRPSLVVRNRNFFGKSNVPGRNCSNADFDEIKIFGRALSDSEIKNDFFGLYSLSEL